MGSEKVEKSSSFVPPAHQKTSDWNPSPVNMRYRSVQEKFSGKPTKKPPPLSWALQANQQMFERYGINTQNEEETTQAKIEEKTDSEVKQETQDKVQLKSDERNGEKQSIQSEASSYEKSILAQPTGPNVIEVDPPIRVCGRNLTHIVVEGPRWRELRPCVPAGTQVLRINIIGRQFVPGRSTGQGRMIFNLHIGIYRDTATNQLCVVVSDPQQCVALQCEDLGCFQDPREAINEFIRAVTEALEDLGNLLILLATILVGIVDAIWRTLTQQTASKDREVTDNAMS